MATKTVTAAEVESGVNITKNPDAIAAVARWKELKEIEAAGKAAKAEREEIEADMFRLLLTPGKDRLIVNGQVVLKESSLRHNSSIDQKALLAGWPEAFEATLKKTPYTFFTA